LLVLKPTSQLPVVLFVYFEIRCERRAAPSDHEPLPTTARKKRPSNMLTSVRASCRVPQKPDFANVTIFVEYKVTVITHKSGIGAKRVNKPASTRLPQMISTVPTREPSHRPGNSDFHETSHTQGCPETKISEFLRTGKPSPRECGRVRWLLPLAGWPSLNRNKGPGNSPL